MGNTKIRDDRVNVFLKELANKRRKLVHQQYCGKVSKFNLSARSGKMLVKETSTKSTHPWCSGIELEGSHIVEDDTLRPSQSGKPFSKEVGVVLESLYRRGMTGFGRKHSQHSKKWGVLFTPYCGCYRAPSPQKVSVNTPGGQENTPEIILPKRCCTTPIIGVTATPSTLIHTRTYASTHARTHTHYCMCTVSSFNATPSLYPSLPP